MGTALHRIGQALCLALAGLAAAPAQAMGSVELSLSTGWVSGSISGLAPPWPFSFRLDGSFAENSRATIDFDDLGVPTLTLSAATVGPFRHYVFDFGAATTAPAVTLGGSRYVAPRLQTFDAQGVVLQSVLGPDLADTVGGQSGGLTTEAGAPASSLPVPEPATGLLCLAGLAGLAGMARRRGG